MVTVDSNIIIYAFSDVGEKKRIAEGAIRTADFLSAQALNEFASVARRKHGRTWAEIAEKVTHLRHVPGIILPVDELATVEALRIVERYRLAFYDALMLAVALAGGARTIYSEDMHDGLVIDGTLKVVDPFRDREQARR
jgi:predicted nucleic acid-binding protein